MKPRKPRSDSKLKTLPADVQERIADWCAQDGLESACSRCSAELQLTTNKTSLGEFFGWWRVQQTFARAEALANDVEESLRKSFPEATPEKIAAAGQLVFTMQAANANDVGTFKDLEYLRVAKDTATKNAQVADAKLRLKERELSQREKVIGLTERRVKLLEDNAAKAKTQLEEVKRTGGLSPEALRQIEEAARLL